MNLRAEQAEHEMHIQNAVLVKGCLVCEMEIRSRAVLP